MRAFALFLLGMGTAVAGSADLQRSHATYRFSEQVVCLGTTVDITLDTVGANVGQLVSTAGGSNLVIYQLSGSAVDTTGAVYSIREAGSFTSLEPPAGSYLGGGKQRVRLVSRDRGSDILLTVNFQFPVDGIGNVVPDAYVSDLACEPSGYRARAPRLRY